MGRTNVDWPPGLGVNPRISLTPTREHEFVHAVAIHDREAEVTVGWHTLDGPNAMPHCLLMGSRSKIALI